MAKGLTADDLLPLIAALTPPERARLVALIARAQDDDASVYSSIPVAPGEFSTDEERLAWDAEGWEDVR